MTAISRLSREQLEQLDKEILIVLVLQLQDQLDGLIERVKKLEDQIAKDSHWSTLSAPATMIGIGTRRDAGMV